MTAYGLDDHAALLLRDYLTGRQQRVKIGDTMSSWTEACPKAAWSVGPLFFNIFLNDLFYFVTKVQLSAYADDQQIYSSDTDHAALYERMNGELAVAVDCFRQNGLMANPDKFQALILGSTNLDFTFVVGGRQIEVHRLDIDIFLEFVTARTSSCR